MTHNNAVSLSRRSCEPECTHCAGKDPDAVARRLRVMENASETNDRWRSAQREDTDLAPVIRWLEVGSERPVWEEVTAESPATKHFVEQWATLKPDHGVLLKRWENARGDDSSWLLVVPRSLRVELLREIHAGLTNGHLGEKKSLSRLHQSFYWVRMHANVEEWCRVCNTCCTKKGPARNTRVPLQLHQVGPPIERLAMDIAAPLPLNSRGNRYICVVMDYFAKWPEAYALPNHVPEAVADVLVSQFLTQFRVPDESNSEQG